jgi:glycosyltransferase involved in cell wall biosynthesis
MSAESHVRENADRPLVSIVVPFKNSERHIAACVESLLGQQEVGGAYEIILIDNRSEDASASIVANYDGVAVLDEPTVGAYAARNTGIRRARAPLIAFTDADCVADGDWLRSLLDGMQDPGVGILLGHVRYPREASPALRVLSAYENGKAEYVIGNCAPAHHFAYANNMAVRASIFDDLGLFKEWKRAGDSELLHRVAAARPELRPAYCRSMRVTHMEFVRARDRARRLSLYTTTNSRIPTFRELGPAQRLGLVLHVIGFGRRGGDRHR